MNKLGFQLGLIYRIDIIKALYPQGWDIAIAQRHYDAESLLCNTMNYKPILTLNISKEIKRLYLRGNGWYD